ncbi:type III-B CRISPR module-associated protein Cmr5 [Thomasclavelia saccharogumia]|uniref:type III-B CRISPR module-associated protein Cmr5 n=1 Tax=Thomasclavelia saccharogumia TaxID=341225 RepID=UPI000B30FAC8|nr:type III-B CRISPR module-associated protein Cmr5 [Thomasclavelia saccharogumia]
MSKSRINRYLPIAYEAVKNSELIKDNKLQGNYQAQIASFGAAVSMGSLLSAIAFFSDNGSSNVKRQELMKLICYIRCETNACFAWRISYIRTCDAKDALV